MPDMKDLIWTILKYFLVGIFCIYFYLKVIPRKTKYLVEETQILDTVFVESLKIEIDTLAVYYPVNQVIDTGAILKDYFTKKKAVSQYQDDEISIQIQDHLYKNNLEKRSLKYTIFPRADPVKVFLGTTVYLSGQQTGLGFGIGVLNKRQFYSLSYDPFFQRFIFGFQYQIKIRSPGKIKGLLKLTK